MKTLNPNSGCNELSAKRSTVISRLNQRAHAPIIQRYRCYSPSLYPNLSSSFSKRCHGLGRRHLLHSALIRLLSKAEREQSTLRTSCLHSTDWTGNIATGRKCFRTSENSVTNCNNDTNHRGYNGNKKQANYIYTLITHLGPNAAIPSIHSSSIRNSALFSSHYYKSRLMWTPCCMRTPTLRPSSSNTITHIRCAPCHLTSSKWRAS
jgi:hypothetical protein